jgi:TetR/AcrR family transcriptional repressor of nem operon
MERQTNREQVVATAAELFIRRGVANTSMDDVVRASGVAKSNIYYHFKSKEEILLAVLDHQIDQFEREIVEPVVKHRSASVMDSLKLFVARLAAELAGRDCAGGCPFITLGTQTAGTNPAVKERIARFFTDQTAKLERMIAYAMLKGEVRKDLKPAEVAGLLMSTIEGSLFLAEVNHAPELLERRALLLLDLLRPNP